MKPLFEDAKPAGSSAAESRPLAVAEPALSTLLPLDLLSKHALDGANLPAVAMPQAPATVAPPRVNEEQIAALGAASGKGLSKVSGKLLGQVKNGEAGDFGQGLTQLVVLAKGLDPASLGKTGFFSRMLGKAKAAKTEMVARYSTVERQMDVLVHELNAKSALHRTRVQDMEQMYLENMDYHTELEQASARGVEILKQLNADLEVQKQVAVHDSFGAQRLADHTRVIARLEKRIDDLQRAMLLSKQTAPQLRLMQDNARALVQKFEDIQAVALPAWKNAFGLYVLQLEQQQAATLVTAVDDATDAALRKSADLLRENTVAIATARQRSVVSVETLAHVQDQLLGSIEDVKRIEQEGRAQRQADVSKIQAMEQALISSFAPGER